MTRNLKALGLALIAVFAMSALAAGSASAAAQFHSEAATTNVSATQTTTHKFVSTAGEVTCEKANFTGSQASPTTGSLTVNASYEGCHIIIFGSTISATVNMNGCQYVLNSETKTAGKATVSLVCPAGKSVVVSGAGCTITIHEQLNMEHASYTNVSPNMTISITVSSIKYTHSGFTCGTGEGSTGTYNGTASASGKATNGIGTRIWHE